MTSASLSLGKKSGWVAKIQPKTILDIGVGWGTFGVVAREKTDAVNGRWMNGDWEVKLYGVEVYKPYTNLPHVKAIYDHVYNLDMVDFVKDYDSYSDVETWDLIHAGDVIEHVEKEEGRRMLEWITNHCNNFILQIPLGKAWSEYSLDPERWDNGFENHKAAWFLHEFGGWIDAMNIPTPMGAVLCAWWKFA